MSVGQLIANSSKFWQFEKSKCKLMSKNDDILPNLRLVKKETKIFAVIIKYCTFVSRNRKIGGLGRRYCEFVLGKGSICY